MGGRPGRSRTLVQRGGNVPQLLSDGHDVALQGLHLHQLVVGKELLHAVRDHANLVVRDHAGKRWRHEKRHAQGRLGRGGKGRKRA